MLVMSPEFKKELKVTKEQDKKIQEALKNMQQEVASGSVSIDFSDPMGSMDLDFDPILTETQAARLNEIFIQANGGFALNDPKVAASLDLAAEQQENVKTINSEAVLELMTMMGEVRSKSDVKALKIKHEEFSDKMLAILTAEQRWKLESLKGKAFKFKT